MKQEISYLFLILSLVSCSATSKQKLNFDLIVDQDIVLHEAYGVWREKMNYGKTYMGVSRSTFVIETDGTLSFVGYNVRASGHVERLMRELGVEG